ncbi:MAG TPA: VOC family protein [Terriglobales bacterium]|nr:VOC family protein [Terriglobales bacterium]
MKAWLNRREVLKLGGVAVAALVAGEGPAGSEAERSLRDAADALDHLMVGAKDLNAGMVWFEKRTGVRPAIGGVHPGRGTRNALASLGGRHYLEIIAPDPAQVSGRGPLLELIRSCKTPRPIGWAASSPDVQATARMVAAAGLKADAPLPGSRQRPDGRLLRWTTLNLEQPGALLPFFIQWSADSPHPSQDAPGGCTLAGVGFESPRPEEVARELRALGIRAQVTRGPEAKVQVALKTPKGAVEI